MSGPPNHPSVWRARLGGAGMAVLTLILLLLTEPRLAIVWDEGYTLGRQQRIRLWFQALRDPPSFAERWRPPRRELVQSDRIPPPAPDAINTRGKLLQAPALLWFWPFAREEPHGHPPFYAIVGLLGDLIVPSWETLPRARFGTMLSFSLLSGWLFAFMTRRFGLVAGLVSAGAWILQPRLFAEAHYATYDALLTSLWMGAALAFAAALEPEPGPGRQHHWGWILAFGLLCGWAADTKLTGWFVPLPCLAWAILLRERRALAALAVGGLVAAITLFLFNPCLWPDPVGGLLRFLQSNLSRARTIPIESLFLGRIYRTPIESLPWYNTLVWVVFVTPVGLLGLALLGAGRTLRHPLRERVGSLFLLHAGFLLALRALPHTPGHDGVRQFLPAFGFLAPIAGLGASWLVSQGRRVGIVLAAAALVEGAASIALMMPTPLSYYSPIVGGLPGATALGMEPTYYWDALTESGLDWLNTRTPPGRSVLFATNPTTWFYLRDSDRLKIPVAPFEPGEPAWYVVQNRPGALRPVERRLIARLGSRSILSARFGVPLVWAFPFEELRREQEGAP